MNRMSESPHRGGRKLSILVGAVGIVADDFQQAGKRVLMQVLKCPHCKTDNTVDECERCGRHFVLTAGRVADRRHEDDGRPVSTLPETPIQPCDYCRSADDGESLLQRMAIGLRQKTCPQCNTEFLSAYGIQR